MSSTIQAQAIKALREEGIEVILIKHHNSADLEGHGGPRVLPPVDAPTVVEVMKKESPTASWCQWVAKQH